MRYLFLLLILFCTSVFAEGTQTFSQVKSIDITKTYLDTTKIVVSQEKEGEKDVLCFSIDGKYKITDNRELILLLLEIITDMKAK